MIKTILYTYVIIGCLLLGASAIHMMFDKKESEMYDKFMSDVRNQDGGRIISILVYAFTALVFISAWPFVIVGYKKGL